MWLRLLTFFLGAQRAPKKFSKAAVLEDFVRKLDQISELFTYIYQKPCICFHISFLIIKARLKKYFSPSFPKKYLNKPLNTDLNVDKLFLSNDSPKNSGVFP